MDSPIGRKLSLSARLEINSIYIFIISEAAVTAGEREKAILSLAYFINGLGKNIAQQRAEMYDIPGALESYKGILKALLYHKPFVDILIPLTPQRSKVLATAFSQYKEYPLLDDIAAYKRMSSSPEFILRFLENKPGFRFADSLLLTAVVNYPLKLIVYLKQG